MQNFPDYCLYVLEMLGRVYGNDAYARERELKGAERLLFHQQRSGPVMEELHHWLDKQLAQKKVEPNSGLGKAIMYLLRHWRGLTAFLRLPNAPIDNNLCERALKRAVLHRKNALFYKTLNGAQAGVSKWRQWFGGLDGKALKLLGSVADAASLGLPLAKLLGFPVP